MLHLMSAVDISIKATLLIIMTGLIGQNLQQISRYDPEMIRKDQNPGTIARTKLLIPESQ